MSERDIKIVERALKKETTIQIHNSKNTFNSILDWKDEYVKYYGGNDTLSRKLKTFIRVYQQNKNKKILAYIYEYLIEDIITKINTKILEENSNNTTYDLEIYKNPL